MLKVPYTGRRKPKVFSQTALIYDVKVFIIDSMNTGESNQLGKNDFDSLHNLTWTIYYNQDILLPH